MPQFTQQQQLVISKTNGLFLVRACPGSGKTTTIVERCDKLFGHGSRMILAFNKNAQVNMREKAKYPDGAFFKTFHAFCLKEIMTNYKQYGFSKKPEVQSRGISLDQLAEASNSVWSSWQKSPLDRDTVDYYHRNFFDHEIEEEIKKKNEEEKQLKKKVYAENPESEAEQIMEQLSNRKIINSCQAILNYRRWLRKNNLLTFDEMIRFVAYSPNLIRNRVDHFMIDEYQDVDRFQYRIAKEFAKTCKSFMAVGDPNQRVYEWRGALEDAFAQFDKDHNDVSILPLTVNFRSYDGIIKKAEDLLPVGMEGVRGDREDSVIVSGLELTELTHLISRPFSQVAVLCRYNRETAQAFLDLAKFQIPAHINSEKGIGDFFQQPHMKVAMEASYKNWTWIDLERSAEWKEAMKQGRFQDPDKKEEAENDAKWLLDLTEEEIECLQDMDNPRGVFISTIHKTKGMEFKQVFFKPPKDMEQEACVNYVAMTRAKDQLVFYTN